MGDVSVTASGATLRLQTGATNNYIADTATLSIVSGSTVDLNFGGAPDTVLSLVVDGVVQPAEHGECCEVARLISSPLTGTGGNTGYNLNPNTNTNSNTNTNTNSNSNVTKRHADTDSDGSTTTPTSTPQPTPTLGDYADTSVSLSGDTTITPSATPANTTSINVSTNSNFKGTFAASPTTGVVTVTDAHPAGTYTVTVTAFGPGGTTTKTFTLTVTSTPCGFTAVSLTPPM